MGEVYLGSSGGIEGAERPCVVKIVRREHAEDKSFLARFFDEARIQAQLQHPGVAQVLEASTDQSGKPYVVLEYVEGRNLSEVRQRAAQLKSPIAWPEAVAVALTLAEALAHVHERTDASGRALEIVHRDLSPQNVMVGYGGDVKLIDFGTARGENRRCQTVAGIVFAKPGYVAPEVANQNQPGPLADLYALGIILWELLMGRRFLNSDPAEHLAQVASGQRNPPAVSLSHNVPLALDTVIARMTAPDPRDRCPSAREAAAELSRVLARAPALTDGDRHARSRISHLMARLYPAEPARSRGDFARLVAESRKKEKPAAVLPESPSPGDVSALLPGTRYRIEREMARSQMSVVYEAVHIDIGRRVALKVLPKEQCDNPHFEARFRSEARAIAQLRHDNLVVLHDFGVSQDGRPYYAMEFLEGQTLEQAAAGLATDWRCCVRLAEQVCDALAVAHAVGFVHRDIKPQNLLITPAGVVKLIDFGVVQGSTELVTDEQSGALRITGTPEYMAPEQVGDSEVDARADLFALAVVLYELIGGSLPHTGETPIQLLNQKQRHKATPLRELRPHAGLPAQLDWTLSKALEAKPENRFDSAVQFKQALELARQAPERQRRTRRVAVASATLAAGFALSAGWPSVVSLAEQVRGLRHAGARSLSLLAVPEQPLVAAVVPASDVGEGVKALGQALPLQDTPLVNGAAQAEADDDEALLAAATPPNAEPNVAVAGPAQLNSAQLNPAEPNAAQPSPTPEPLAQGAGNQEPLKASDVLTEVKATRPLLPAVDQNEVIRANALLERDGEGAITALDLFRKLGQRYPDHPAVLAGWSRAAAKGKWWGEALRVALRWASLDDSQEAQLHLAKTQRLLGQRFGAIQTLEKLLARAPSQEAQAMIQRYRKD
jgi:serine/threonine-protein kinase